ncbi:MAG: PilZ domain-containing protein [Deltaproteobacteria bacterium]|nr:PilZ domain-containing protein [Deltaproteobacteria bacterium]
MLLVLTSKNQDLVWRLDSSYFRRLGVLHKEVDTGAELLKQAIALRPQLMIVNWELPDMDGFDLCGILRTRPELLHMRIVVAVRKEHLSQTVIRKAEHSGAHNVIGYPCSDEELFQGLSQALGLPRRIGRRIRVTVDAKVTAGSDKWVGQVKDLGEHGARIVLPGADVEALRRHREFSVSMSRHMHQGRPIQAKAQAVWYGIDPEEGGASLGLEFVGLDSELRRGIIELAFWEILPDSEPTVVLFRGDVTESTEFGSLPEMLSGTVRFDLSGIRYINSTGVRSWVYFLEALQDVDEYEFVHASHSFVRQASMVPRLLGRGVVRSFFARYLCEACNVEELQLLEVEARTTVESLLVRRFHCPRCGAEMILDDIPDHIFGFLVTVQRG